jgi:hypothetical protein
MIFKLTSTFKYIFSSILVFIYLYSGLEKIIDFEKFVSTLSKSPFIPYELVKLTAVLIIIIEILLVIFISSSKFKLYGFLISFLLLLLFESYIVLMIIYSPYLPCSCGGFIEYLSWNQHIIFNMILMILSLVCYYHTPSNQQ